MSIITSIKPQKNKKRVNIYLDDKFGFGLDLENFVKLGLKVEQELSEDRVAEILKKAELQKTLEKLLRFSTLRPRSEREINNWLKKYKVHRSLISSLLKKLKRLELLDDKKFAQWWVDQRMSFRPRSKRILNQELRIKGIDRNTIEDVLAEVVIDEVKIAKEILSKKMYKWEKLPEFEAKKKMGEFLARKGFGWSIINKVIKELTTH